MRKKIIIPSKLEDIKILNKADAFLLNIEIFSVNANFKIKLYQVKEILENTKKEIFINVNKNIHSTDLELLEKTLIELSNLPITGIFFYDLAIVNINKRLNLGLNLIWAQEHLTVSIDSINFWNDLGVSGALLSTSLNLSEIKDIKEETSSVLIMPVFGYMSMFTSKRKLITSYQDAFNQDNNIKNTTLSKEGKEYIITEDDQVTTLYTSEVLNLSEHIKELENIDYILLNSFNIENFNEVLENFETLTDDEITTIIKKTTDTHKLFERTIYKVKK